MNHGMRTPQAAGSAHEPSLFEAAESNGPPQFVAQGQWVTEAGGVIVSTRYRESSAWVNDAPWYWETFGFRDGRIVWQSWSYFHADAVRQHDIAVRYYGSRP